MIYTCLDKLRVFPYFEVEQDATFDEEVVRNIYEFVTMVYETCLLHMTLSKVEDKVVLTLESKFKYENVLTTIKEKINDKIPKDSMFDVKFKFDLLQD